MAPVGKSGGGTSSSSSSTQRTRSNSSAKSTTKTSTKTNHSTTRPSKAPQDKATLSHEKEKAGAIPDFSKSFGADAAADPKAAAEAKKDPLTGTFRKGMKGDDVKQLQEMLNSKGAHLDVDGKFGKDTARAVREFQEKEGIQVDGIAGKDTLGHLQGTSPGTDAKPGTETKPGTEVKPGTDTKPASGNLDLPPGYEGLEKLSGELSKRDSRFNTDTPEGRAATALALAIGGTEQFGKDTKATNFFTAKGGTGNNMLGFAQFNQKFHANKTNSPEKYTKFLGDILTGESRMPNSRKGGNHVEALTKAIEAGKIKTGKDLVNFMHQRGFGGSNWQGIDDGWGRNPGLANALTQFLNNGA